MISGNNSWLGPANATRYLLPQIYSFLSFPCKKCFNTLPPYTGFNICVSLDSTSVSNFQLKYQSKKNVSALGLYRDRKQNEISQLSLTYFTHSSRCLNDRWGIKDDRAITFLHSSLSSAFRRASPNPNPDHSDIIIFPSLFLSAFSPPSLYRALLDHLCKTCWSCHVSIPFQFAFSHSVDKVFIRLNK